MIVSIWVYFLLGEPLAGEQGTPYVQVTAPAFVHDTDGPRAALEKKMNKRFHQDFPGHVVIDGGWVRQRVQVNEQ